MHLCSKLNDDKADDFVKQNYTLFAQTFKESHLYCCAVFDVIHIQYSIVYCTIHCSICNKCTVAVSNILSSKLLTIYHRNLI